MDYLVEDIFKQVDQIRSDLLGWYHENKRDLPWRGETDPYRIWISEVMLQQTQVATVIPYYQRFLELYPSVEDLAAASLDEVLKAWEGLGYYARARNLHKAALRIVNKCDGQLPDNYADLRQLPGFGEYTAGAVAAIAFGQVVPAVDGNVKRVLARLFAIETNVSQGQGAKQVATLATDLVDPQHPGDWTEALMELGATVCQPQVPRCLGCPLNNICQARLQGLELELPFKPPKKKLPHYDVAAAVIHRDGQFLIAQRPLEGMLGGLWEFPGGKCQSNERLSDCLRREIREELGVEIDVGEVVTVIKHSYTHFKITLHAFYCQLVQGTPQAIEVADWRWVTPAEFNSYPFPRTDLKIIQALSKL